MRQSGRTAARDGTKSRQRLSYVELQARIGALEAELAEALEQQTATAEVLQVINSSPGDLGPVFDAILDKAMGLCEAAHGHVWIYDGERAHPVAVHGEPQLVEWMRRVGSVGPFSGSSGRPSPLGWVVRGEPIAHVADALEEEAYRSVPVFREMVDVGGIRTILDIALRKGDAPLGIIALYRQEVRPFSDKQIALLQNFAAQAVIAMENARLLTETREALEQQTATAEVLQVINSSPGDVTPVFDAILQKAHTLCGVVHGSLQLYDGEHFRAVATLRVPGPLAGWLRQGYHPSPNMPHWRLVDGEPFVQIPDLAEVDDPAEQRAVELGSTRTLLYVALRKDNAFLGLIASARKEVRPFSDKEIALLQNFAAQAVIAIENTRLLTETRESLEQQTATAEVLGVINSSPGELTPVFDAMLEKAMRLCEAAFGFMMIYDGDRFRPGAQRGVPSALAEYFAAGPDRPGPGEAHTRILAGEDLIHSLDYREEEPYRLGAPLRRAVVDLGGARTALVIALRKERLLLGTFTIYRQEVRPFSDKQIALLENFAAQAVIAMENARLLGELRQRTGDLQESLEYQTATSDVFKVISRSTFDLQPVLETVAETAARLCEADTAFIMRRDGEVYRASVQIGNSPEFEAFMQSHPITPSRGSTAGRVALEGRAVQIVDVVADPEYTVTEAITIGRTRTHLGVPLLRENEPIGVIVLTRRTVRPFTEKQIALVTTFADQAVIAIENARLLGELRQRTDEIAGWNRELEARVAEQVEELGRVGRLKRFLAPQLAELIVSQGDEKILESHRREIVVVFCDLRGYTAFTETAEPEEVLDFLRGYHGALGPLVSQYEGTLDQFSGDGIMVFFNDPVPCPDPAERAVKMAMAMREEAGKLIVTWRRDGCELGFGAGIAQGYATLGQIGFSERSGYTAIGTVCNLAARLCAEAKDGQILISSRVARAVEAVARLEDLGNLELKGLRRPVAAFNVVQSTGPAEARPNLTIVAKGPGA